MQYSRQTIRQADRQICRQTDRQKDIYADIKIGRQAEGQLSRHQIGRQADREICRQSGRQTMKEERQKKYWRVQMQTGRQVSRKTSRIIETSSLADRQI